MSCETVVGKKQVREFLESKLPELGCEFAGEFDSVGVSGMGILRVFDRVCQTAQSASRRTVVACVVHYVGCLVGGSAGMTSEVAVAASRVKDDVPQDPQLRVRAMGVVAPEMLPKRDYVPLKQVVVVCSECGGEAKKVGLGPEEGLPEILCGGCVSKKMREIEQEFGF